jgi:hypothetical protein
MRNGMHVVKQTLDQGWDIVADRDGLQSDWHKCYVKDAVLQYESNALEREDAGPLVNVLQDAEVVMSQCCQCLGRVQWS